jgi:hypothetical protein
MRVRKTGRRKPMKRIYPLTDSAVVMLWSLAPANAATKPKNESPSTEAQVMFAQIDATSTAIAETAYNLGVMAKDQRDPQSHLEGLHDLREDINKVGSELQALEAERSSLSEWESKALDQILPLMQDVAGNTEKALQTFNSDRQRLWATSYVDDTATVTKEADQVATLLRDYLKLARTREKESRIEQSLGETQ